MTTSSVSALTTLGLTEKEATLYLTAIKLGPATAQVLALDSNLKRATVYALIETLIDKGLLHIEIQGTKKYFVGESPEKLLVLLDKKKQAVTTVLPQLMERYRQVSPACNTIKVYEGLPAIQCFYDTILNTLHKGDEYLVISDQKKWHALDPAYFETFMQKRATLGLTTKLILQDNAEARAYQAREDTYQQKVKLLPESVASEMNGLFINLVILPQKILMTQTVEPLSMILIENQHVAHMHNTFFHWLWSLL